MSIKVMSENFFNYVWSLGVVCILDLLTELLVRTDEAFTWTKTEALKPPSSFEKLRCHAFSSLKDCGNCSRQEYVLKRLFSHLEGKIGNSFLNRIVLPRQQKHVQRTLACIIQTRDLSNSWNEAAQTLVSESDNHFDVATVVYSFQNATCSLWR